MSEKSDNNQDHSARIQSIFDAVVDLNEHDRSIQLDKLCQNDLSIRAEVESLLSAFDNYVHGVSIKLSNTDLEADDPLVDQVIKDYKIISLISIGGMGRVYKGVHVQLGSPVAIKALYVPNSIRDDLRAEERFLQEARTVANLDHPNIAYVHDIASKGDQLFIIMRYYDGHTIKDRLKLGPIPIKESINYAIQIAKGLQEAHRKGIIHRDIKPGNLILSSDNVVKIIDFGLAKVEGASIGSAALLMLGTKAYVSPEQSRHDQLDYRTDIWSLGVTLYEMISGEKPFRDQVGKSVISAIQNSLPVPISLLNSPIPKALDTILHKCLEKNPNKRYTSTQDLINDLEKISKTQPLNSRQFSTRVQQPSMVIRPISLKAKYQILAASTLLISILISVHFFTGPATGKIIAPESDTIVNALMFNIEKKNRVDNIFNYVPSISVTLNSEKSPQVSIEHVNTPISDLEKTFISLAQDKGANFIIWGWYKNETEVIARIEKIDTSSQHSVPFSPSDSLVYPIKIEASHLTIAEKIRVNLLYSSARFLIQEGGNDNIKSAHKITQRIRESLPSLQNANSTPSTSFADTTLTGLLLAIGYKLGTQYDEEIRTYAIQVLKEALSLTPTKNQLYWIHSKLGSLYGNEWRLADALDSYASAIMIYPNRTQAYMSRGSTYNVHGRFEDALLDFNIVSQISRSTYYSYRAFLSRGLIYSSMNEHEKALIEFSLAINIDPSLGVAYKFRELSNKRLGYIENARKDSTAATLKIKPPWGPVYRK